MLRIVSVFPDFFAHQGTWAVDEGLGFGCDCARCGRAVSAPFEFQGSLIWCLYCGLEVGHVPELDVPFGHKYDFGVTRQECIEDAHAADHGDLDALILRRARQYGQLLGGIG